MLEQALTTIDFSLVRVLNNVSATNVKKDDSDFSA